MLVTRMLEVLDEYGRKLAQRHYAISHILSQYHALMGQFSTTTRAEPLAKLSTK